MRIKLLPAVLVLLVLVATSEAQTTRTYITSDTLPTATWSIAPTNYAVVDMEFNLYLDNVLLMNWPFLTYEIQVTAPVLFAFEMNQAQEFLRLTPTAAMGTSNGSMTITASWNTNVVATSTPVLRIAAAAAGNGVTRKILLIGDSTTASHLPITYLNNLCATNGFHITPIGTQGTYTNVDEGWAGYSMERFRTGSNGATPFTNGAGVFDFNFYLTNNSFTMASGDWVIFNLGINDVFSYSSDAAVATQINGFLTNFAFMASNIISTVSGVRVGLCATTPSARSQDAFGVNYGSYYRIGRVRRNQRLLAANVVAYTQTGVRIIGLNSCVDTLYNYPLTTRAANANNSTSVSYQGNAVHPDTTGYAQVAAALFAFLKGNE